MSEERIELLKAVLRNEQNQTGHCLNTENAIESVTHQVLEDSFGLELQPKGIHEFLSFLVCNNVAEIQIPAVEYIESLRLVGPKKVCQLAFKRNDIVWICKSCQMDETCVLCNACFRDSNHDGHEVYFYHAQAGGCCDCGDAGAWDPGGFCSLHGHTQKNPLANFDPNLIANGRTVMTTVVSSIVTTLQSVRHSMDLFRYIGYRHARRKKERQGCTSWNTSPPQLEAVTDLLHVNETVQLIVHWDDNSNQSTLVGALLALRPFSGQDFQFEGFIQQEAESLATRCHSEGYVMLASFPALVLKAALEASQSEESEALFRPDGVQELLGLCDVFFARDFRVWAAPPRVQVGLSRAVHAVKWLRTLADSCDGMKRLVCESLENDSLVSLLLVECLAPKHLSVSLHGLFLELMADQDFKVEMARCYVAVYRGFSHRYARGIGLADSSLYTLAVQFLNRDQFVSVLVEQHSLLSVLARTVLDTLSTAAKPPISTVSKVRLLEEAQLRLNLINTDSLNESQESIVEDSQIDFDDGTVEAALEAAADASDDYHLSDVLTEPLYSGHTLLLTRRYSPIIADLKCVLNVPGIARRFCIDPPHDIEEDSVDEERRLRRRRQRDCLGLWMQSLACVQGIDPLHRVVAGAHVEFEHRHWMNAFNINISLSAVFEHMVSWLRTANQSDSSSIHELLARCADAVLDWNTLYLGQPTWVEAPVHSQPFSMRLWSKQMIPNPSFHAPLIRFLGHMIVESTRAPCLTSVLATLVSCLGCIDTLGLIEVPLSILVMAAEAKSGLWKRNGQNMMDQLMNYQEPPFCRLFRDLDLYFLQFAALLYPDNSCDEGVCHDRTNLFVNHLMHRFGCWAWLTDSTDATLEIEARSLDQQSCMAEELLLLFIIFVTEMPVAAQGFFTSPVADCYRSMGTGEEKDERMIHSIRREMIHRLAQSPCTHSEAHECVALVARSDAVGPALLEAMLAAVAERREAVGLDPVKFNLRQECWSEYDPCFFHLNAQNHQSAAERKPLIKGPSRSVRAEIESELLTANQGCDAAPDNIAHRSKLADLLRAKSCGGGEGDDSEVAFPIVASPPPAHPLFHDLRSSIVTDCTLLHFVFSILHQALDKSSERETFSGKLLMRGLHLITISLHVVATLPPSHPHRLRFFVSLLEVHPDSNRNFIVALQALLTTSWAADPSMKSGANWVLNMSSQLDSGCAALTSVSSEKAKGPSLESKKAAARAKALADVAARANKFMLENMGTDSEEEGDGTFETSPKKDNTLIGDANAAAGCSELECIICREDNGEPLGYLGFAQLGRNFRSAGRHQERRCGIAITCCGHALHNECYQTYFATTVQQSEQTMARLLSHGLGHLALDLSAGELQCPFCKTVANLLVPCRPVTPPEDAAASDDRPLVDSASLVSWLGGLIESKLSIEDHPLESGDSETQKMASAFVDSVVYISRSQNMSSHLTLEASMARSTPSSLKKLSAGCWAVAYSVSTLVAERSHLGAGAEESVAEESGTVPEERKLQHLGSVAWALVLFSEAPTVYEPVAAYLKDSFAATISSDVAPLLSRNILETLVGLLVLPAHVRGDSASALQSMYVARLVQLLWSEVGDLRIDQLNSFDAEEASLLELAAMVQNETSPQVNQHEETVLGGGGGNKSTDTDNIGSALARVRVGMAAFTEASEVIMDLLQQPKNNSPLSASNLLQSSSLITTIKAWIQHALAACAVSPPTEVSVLVRRMGSDYPWNVPVELTPLPLDYTELHLDLMNRMDAAAAEKELKPALCLLCGDVMDGDGKGTCTAHTKHCGLGIGMFFLLQDCNVVVMHGPRASYLASPYVDDHGERHGQFRGRPLYLNQSRVKVLRSIVANHKIPSSVVFSRTTTSKVIISGYY